MIPLIEGFSPETAEPIDSRILLTKEEMKSMDDNIMPDTYFSVDIDTGDIYLYSKTNTEDPETGKFRLYAEPAE